MSTDELAKAGAILDRGENASGLVKKPLARVLELEILLDKFAANKTYPWKYKTLINESSRLIERVELNGIEAIERERDKLNKSMMVLYDKSLQYAPSHESPSIEKDSQTMDIKK